MNKHILSASITESDVLIIRKQDTVLVKRKVTRDRHRGSFQLEGFPEKITYFFERTQRGKFSHSKIFFYPLNAPVKSKSIPVETE